MPDLDVLRTLGDQLAPPPFDSLRETARRRDRRAKIASVAVSAAAVVAVTATAVVLSPDDAPDSRPVEPPRIEKPSTRPLTYADGSTIHYGDATVDAGGRVAELDLTDEGVAFRTYDGRIWFSDGSSIDEIGEVGEPVEPAGDLGAWDRSSDFDGAAKAPGWIVSGNSGSHLMWFDFTVQGAPEVVVYDTSARDVVLRTGVDIPPGSWVGPHSVTEDSAYFYRDPDPVDSNRLPQVLLDLTTGAQTPIPTDEYLADAGSPPARSFQISHADQGFKLYEIIEGPGKQFDVHRGRLRPMGMLPIEVRDGLSGDELALRAPDGYPNTNPVWLTQWLDDDSVVIFDGTGNQDRLLVCPVPKGTCEIAVTGPSSMVVPDAWWE